MTTPKVRKAMDKALARVAPNTPTHSRFYLMDVDTSSILGDHDTMTEALQEVSESVDADDMEDTVILEVVRIHRISARPTAIQGNSLVAKDVRDEKYKEQ